VHPRAKSREDMVAWEEALRAIKENGRCSCGCRMQIPTVNPILGQLENYDTAW
jgi:hypothetical protein